MSRIRLIHWKSTQAEEMAAVLRRAGHEIDSDPFDRDGLRELKARPPAAVIIDLSRSPSMGRDLGLLLRKGKGTRHLPLLFVGGETEKVKRIRKLLPDAVYTTWGRCRSSLKRAIACPPAKPVVPRSVLEGYAGTPLPKKLGMKPGFAVALVGSPQGFETTLGTLPEGVRLRRGSGRCDLLLWFVRTRQDLERRVRRMGASAGKGGLWIIWPKRSSGMTTDLSQTIVRRVGLAAGLVDFKVCAVDANWAGLRFTRRAR